MKIAIATRAFATVASHAGQARDWLIYDCRPGQVPPAPARVTLAKAQLPHNFEDDGPHPLDGVEVLVAGSAGDGFVRHMAKRGTQVLVTGETDPDHAPGKILAGEALADPRFDPTTLLCKLRDLFSKH